MDLAGIESLGEAYGEINVEKLAALMPDLVVVPFDPRQDGPLFGFVEGPVQGQVETIARIIAIDCIKDPVDVMRRFEELAADLRAPAITAARKRFENAGSALRAAVADKPDLLAVALYATPTEGISRRGRRCRRSRPGRSPHSVCWGRGLTGRTATRSR